MSTLEINGHDPRAGAYRVALKGGPEALIPDALIADEVGQSGPQQAEAWIAAMAHDLAEAIRTLATGGTPRPPFDRIRLAGSPT